MSIAPLHPTHATEPTPTYERLWTETQIARLFAPLHAVVTPKLCDTCGAVGDQPCREGGKFVGRHGGRQA